MGALCGSVDVDSVLGRRRSPRSVRARRGRDVTQSARRRRRPTMKDVAEHARVSVIFMNDLMAIGAMEHCREVGLRVPEDVSVVGFDDLPVSALLTPRLTTVRQPAHDMGFRAASALFVKSRV
ncbi:substrate-binding domain-containing protein [Pseudonocardia oceani]|uniref:substrate-binding domain-containing protein n=1 Tax=Pseudonocardia oceani TaxID=2792013 RepID=UPI0027DFE016|nr:substrate-binding domain-containing protein [Pseudonocardia oceani]